MLAKKRRVRCLGRARAGMDRRGSRFLSYCGMMNWVSVLARTSASLKEEVVIKALILSCNTGGGHNTAGRALLEALQARGLSCEMRDTLAFAGRNTSRTVSGSYIKITQYVPGLFGTMYHAGDFISSAKRHSPVYFANTLYAKALGDYVTKNGYDTVFSPHLFPAEALTYLRGRGLRVRSYGVATDYTCTPFWEETDVDVFFIPHEDLRAEYEAKGFAPERLVVTGIPVSRRFADKTPQAAARAKLGLKREGALFLLMTGSMGFGDVPELVDDLLRLADPAARVLVLTGNNPRLMDTLAARYGDEPRVRAIGFTREVALYMDACDVLLTKPGGLSSTEAAVKNVPTVHTAPIPGCETENARFFGDRGASVAATDAEDAARAAVRLAADPAACEAMLACQRAVVNPRAADDILDYALRRERDA